MDRGYSYYGEVRLGHSFFLGPIGLGNWPHMLYNGPHLSPWDVLSHGTLCPLRRFVLGSFRPWNNVPWDVLSLGMLVPGTFCLGTCCATFCMCIQNTVCMNLLYNILY